MGQYIRNPPELKRNGVLARRYELLEKQFGDGYGEVWVARDTENCAATVVSLEITELPFSNDSSADNPEIEDFLRAFNRTGLLPAHASIPQVLSSGIDIPNQRAFHVYPQLKSRLLRDLATDLTLPLERSVGLSFIRKLLEGFGVAHSSGWLHMLVSPDTILATDDYEPSILGFSLSPAEQSHAHRLGSLVPLYASPEQLEGALPSVRDDIYAVGCICYLIVSGELPYGRVIAREAKRLKANPYYVDGLSEIQNAVLAKAVSLDAEARWPSAVAMLNALDESPRT